jgi:lipoprotein-releasing system permease protein
MSERASALPFGKLERTLAWRYLRAKREHGGASLISIISFVGIFFAVAALIITMSVMSGFRATLLNAFTGGQPHIAANVSAYSDVEAQEIANILKDVDGVTTVFPIIEEFVLVTANGRKNGAVVRGVMPENLATMKFLEDGGQSAVDAGFGKGSKGGNVIMMGEYLASGAEGLRIRIGDAVEVVTTQVTASPMGGAPRKKGYVVGGVFQTGSVELDYLYIFMPMAQAQILFNSKGKYESLDIRIDNPDDTGIVMQRIHEATGYSLALQDWQSQRASYLNALQIERTMVRLLVMVIMAIATLNIIVGVVMLVKNKTRDVAILRTMGLSQGGVLRVFLMIGTVLGTLGALLGILVGVAVVKNIGAVEAFINLFVPGNVFDADTYGISGLPAILDWGEVVRTGLYALFMSMFVSLIPAWWASRQDPVDALRFE